MLTWCYPRGAGIGTSEARQQILGLVSPAMGHYHPARSSPGRLTVLGEHLLFARHASRVTIIGLLPPQFPISNSISLATASLLGVCANLLPTRARKTTLRRASRVVLQDTYLQAMLQGGPLLAYMHNCLNWTSIS